MSSTRSGRERKLRAITTGADYGTKAAGATTVGLNALSLCGFMISNPIILAIAGGVCAIFCCLGSCYAWRKPTAEDLDEDNHDELQKVERYLGEIKSEMKQQTRRLSIPRVNHYSLFTRNNYGTSPADMKMEEDEVETIGSEDESSYRLK